MAEKKTTYTLEAQDRFSAVLGDFKKQLNGLQNQTASLESAFNSFKSALEGVGVALSITALAAWVKTTMDAADEIGKLSQKTGIAVGQLSQLSYGAKLAGVDVDAFAKGMKTFSQRLVEASDGTTKSAKIFRELGVDISAGPAKALEQFAQGVSTMGDGQVKTALATEALGKVGMNLIPWLNQGAAGFKKAADEAARLGIVMGEDAVKAATQFNENMKALKASSEALGVTFVNRFGQGLAEATGAIKEALIQSGKLTAAWVALGAAGAFVFTDMMLSEADKYRKKMVEVNDELVFYNKQAQIAAAMGSPDRSFANIVAKLQGQLAAMRAAQDAVNGAFGDQVSRSQQQGRGSAAASVDTAREKRIQDILTEKNAKGDLTAAGDALIASLEKELEHLTNLSGIDEKLIQVNIDLAKLKKEGKPVDEDEARRLASRIDLQKNYNFFAQQAAKDEQALTDAWKNQKNAVDVLIGSLASSNRELKFEIDEVGKSKEQRELDNIARQKSIDLTKAMTPEQKTLIEQEYNERAALVAVRQERELQLSVWTQLADIGSRAFADWASGGKRAIDVLRDAVKNLWKDLVQLFAQKWILSLGATLAGGGASGALASSAAASGAGSIAGSVLSGLGSTSFGGAVSSQFAGFASAFTVGADATGMGAMAAGTGFTAAGAGTFGSMIGTAIMSVPVWGWIAAGITALAVAFRDKGENWKGQLAFGPGATAYTSTGVFGTQGFSNLQGDDAVNRAMQTFMQNTTLVDAVIARTLTSSQIAAITTNLGGSYTTRNDGQPAEFAFGKGDNTAPEQLTLEFLQHKYGAVFDQIDTKFAAFIRGYEGKAADLWTQISDFSSLLDALSGTKIKGLNPDALRAMQQQGETLAQTFARVTATFAQFDSAFTSDAQKLDNARTFLTSTFHDLGVAIPASSADFYTLVHSIDVSTEAGRNMVTQLLAVAPAFQTVEQAAASAVNSFNSIAASLSPSFGAANARSVLESAVQHWMGISPGNSAGWTIDSTIANIGSLVNSGNIGSALTYAQGLGGDAVSTLNAMLQAYSAWMSASSTATPAVGGFSSTVGNASTAVSSFVNALDTAKQSLASYQASLLLDSKLSPLSPAAQLAEAQKQFQGQLTLAKGGDAGAVGGLGNSFSTLLTIARGQLSQSGYNALFSSGFEQLSGISGFDSSRLFGASGSAANDPNWVAIRGNTAAQVSLLADLNDEVAQLRTDLVAATNQLTAVVRRQGGMLG